MSAIGSANLSGTSAAMQGSSRSMMDLTTDDFLRLLIMEMTNQDPLEPMDNQHLLEQISSMRSMELNTAMLKDFTGLLFGQQLSSSSGLIGKTVTGLADSGEEITGVVESVSVNNYTIRLIVGDDTMSLGNITGITTEG